MKWFGQISELTRIVFRKASRQVTIEPATQSTGDATITIPDMNNVSQDLVLRTQAQTLTNKSIDADTNTITNIEDADIKAGAAINAAKIANGSVSNTEFQRLDGVGSAVVGVDDTQTLTNKTLTNPTVNAAGGNIVLPDQSAPTAAGQVAWDATNERLRVGTGTATKTMIDANSAQTLTNKTLTSPTIGSISNGGTVSIPSGTTTLVGTNTTDTLTNKTLTSPVLNTSISGTAVETDLGVSAAADKLAMAAAIKGYVDAQIALVSTSSAPSGMVVPFAGASAPSGWLMCNGDEVSKTTYANLFAAIGTTYDTQTDPTTGSPWAAPAGTNFRVPDYRGVFLRGVGTPSGQSAVTLGGYQADQNLQHTHTVSASGSALSNGAHTHGLSATAESAGSHTHTNNSGSHPTQWVVRDNAGSTIGNGGGAVAVIAFGTMNSGGAHTHNVVGTATTNGAHTHTVDVTGSTNQNGGTEVRVRNKGVNYIIKT